MPSNSYILSTYHCETRKAKRKSWEIFREEMEDLNEAASTVHTIGNTRTEHDQETTDPGCQYVGEGVVPHTILTTANMGELISTIVDEEKIKWEVKTFQIL